MVQIVRLNFQSDERFHTMYYPQPFNQFYYSYSYHDILGSSSWISTTSPILIIISWSFFPAEAVLYSFNNVNYSIFQRQHKWFRINCCVRKRWFQLWCVTFSPFLILFMFNVGKVKLSISSLEVSVMLDVVKGSDLFKFDITNVIGLPFNFTRFL